WLALGTTDARVLNPGSLLPVALEAVSLAGKEVRARPSHPIAAHSKGDRDLVSAIDLAVERHAREFLRRRTPEIGFLGEEEGTLGRSPDLFWVLDPIDGTVNFVRGLPLCAVALALVHERKPVIGVIDLPFFGSRYSAVVDEGA